MHRPLFLFVALGVLALAAAAADTAPTAPPAAGTGTSGGGPATPKTISTASPAMSVAMSVAMDEGNVVRLRPGEMKTTVLLTINGVPDGDLRKTPPTLTDVPNQAAADAKVGPAEASVRFSPRELLQNASTVMWLVDVELLKANAQGARLATIELGGHKLALPYVLTDEPAAAVAATWTATASSPWIVRSDRDPLPVIVTANETPLTGVQVLDSTLRNAFERIGPERMEVCTDVREKGGGSAESNGEAECVKSNGEAQWVPARSSATVYVRLKDSVWGIPHGKFDGVITLKANSPLQQTLTVSMQSSSWWMKFLGLLAVVIGLWVAKYVMGKLIPTAQRVQALRPVLAVRAAITELNNEAVRLLAPVTNSAIRDRLAALQKSVSTEELDMHDLLPRGFLSPLPLAAKAVGTLEAKLSEVATALKAVSAVVYKGLRVAAADRVNTAYDSKDVDRALQKLDELGGDKAKNESVVLEEVAAILMAYRVRPRAGVAAHTKNLRGPMDPVSVREAEYRIYEAGQQAWLVWMVISVIASVPLIFIPNFASFSWQDVITCLMWGFGLPIGGAALQALTPTSVASGIGLTLPKAQ